MSSIGNMLWKITEENRNCGDKVGEGERGDKLYFCRKVGKLDIERTF